MSLHRAVGDVCASASHSANGVSAQAEETIVATHGLGVFAQNLGPKVSQAPGFVLSVADIFGHPELLDMAECVGLPKAAEPAIYAPLWVVDIRNTPS
jgi:hypothetical protein